MKIPKPSAAAVESLPPSLRHVVPRVSNAAMRARRHELRMTLAELSGLTGLTESMLSRIETGGRRPSIEVQMKIARGLGVPVHELFPRPGA